MIDQTKDKKDDVLASKIEADKDQKQKTGLPQAMKDPAKVDPEKAQKLAQIEKEKAELSKAQKGADKLKEQAGNNASKAMQPIGSARVMQKAEVHSEPGKTGTRLTELPVQRQIDILAVQGAELKVEKKPSEAGTATDWFCQSRRFGATHPHGSRQRSKLYRHASRSR